MSRAKKFGFSIFVMLFQAPYRLRVLRCIAVIFLGLVAAAAPAAAQTYGPPVNLSNNSLYNYYIQINDQGHVVWVSSDSPSGSSGSFFLNLYDGDTISVIRSTTDAIGPPKINANGVVVWSEAGALWRYSNGGAESITPTSELAFTNPSINDAGEIAFAGEDLLQYLNAIFLYSGGGVPTEVATHNGGNPAINNNGQIVYSDDIFPNAIHLINGGVISSSSACNELPAINGAGQAIWRGALAGSMQCGGNYSIYFYDGATVKIISNSAGDESLSKWQRGQLNDGGQAVWQDYNSGSSSPDIYMYSAGAAQNLSQTVSQWNGPPQINNNGQVVWYGADPVKLGSQLYLYSGGAVQQLVDNAGSSDFLDDFTGSPVIDNQGRIAFLGNDQQVYLISSGLWQNASATGNGWYYLSTFGAFSLSSSGWIYHLTLGWLYPVGTSTDSIWFYDPQWDSAGGWWWTSGSLFPWMYSVTEDKWFYYDAKDSTLSTRWFFTGGGQASMH